MSDLFQVTHIGTACLLLEIAGFRILTDPVFDPPGKRYWFPFFLSSRKTEAPALQPNEVLPLDIILLSHDHHADNLDDRGRALLPDAQHVLSTPSAEIRLSSQLGSKVAGLKNWESREFESSKGEWLKITAVPSRHYQRPLFKLLVGETTGFVIQWGDKLNPSSIYLSGDTVNYPGLTEISERFKIHTAFMHLGGVRFGLTGPIRYTLTTEEARNLALTLKVNRLIPVHYSGWTHFREPFEKRMSKLNPLHNEYEVLLLTRGQRLSLTANAPEA